VIERLERAQVVPDVRVLRSEVFAQTAVQPDQVLGERPVGRDVADDRLPRMTMRIDEPGKDDPARDIHHLGLTAVHTWSDRGDPIAIDQHVARPDRRGLGIAGQDDAASQERPLAGHAGRDAIQPSWAGTWLTR
jgi:hypothetical protein